MKTAVGIGAGSRGQGGQLPPLGDLRPSENCILSQRNAAVGSRRRPFFLFF